MGRCSPRPPSARRSTSDKMPLMSITDKRVASQLSASTCSAARFQASGKRLYIKPTKQHLRTIRPQSQRSQNVELIGCQSVTVVELPFAADCCPCVEKLRTVLPFTVGIRDGRGIKKMKIANHRISGGFQGTGLFLLPCGVHQFHSLSLRVRVKVAASGDARLKPPLHFKDPIETRLSTPSAC